MRKLYTKLLKQIQDAADGPEARDLVEVKRKDEEYHKMSKDFESM